MDSGLKDNRILTRMLDRLFAALVNGPSLNAKPHSSRQRIDFTQLAKLQDRPLDVVLKDLLDADREAKIVARVPLPRRRLLAATDGEVEESELSPEEKAAIHAYSDQQSVINKCRAIAEDAKSYENDTGVHVLQIGFPLLSLPPGSTGAKSVARRITAPICLISLAMTVKGGPNPSITLECRNEGADLVQPNIALLAWLEAQAGREIGELESDETGDKPWDEIAQTVSRAAQMLNMPIPPEFASGEALLGNLALRACPRADEEDAKPQIISSAIVGLFPLTNQGLIRDTQALLGGEPASGPIESFLNAKVLLEQGVAASTQEEPQKIQKSRRLCADERFIAAADPCQARAVKLARKARGLVVHGPPGTGKSQTIANIIGDHLSRGQRVLFVCDKRTALDVVMNRLDAMGLANLCAIVHDPQRDQRELYKSIREQLDTLSELRTKPSAEKRLETLDSEMQALHDELTEQHAALMQSPDGSGPSFHELIGGWLQLQTEDVKFDNSVLASVPLKMLEANEHPISELLERALSADYAGNPWVAAAGVSLGDFLAAPMDQVRNLMRDCCDKAAALDATAAANPFAPDEDVVAGAADRARLAEQLSKLAASDPARLAKWAQTDPRIAQQNSSRLVEMSKQIELIAAGPLDAELAAAVRAAMPTMSSLNQQIVALEQFLISSSSFLGVFAFGVKKAAANVLTTFGLQRNAPNATRVRAFLAGLKARQLVRELTTQLNGVAASAGESLSDDQLLSESRHYQQIFAMLQAVDASSHLKPLRQALASACGSPEQLSQFIDGLERSKLRANAIVVADARLRSANLFAEVWQAEIRRSIRVGEPLGARMTALSDRLATLENILRVREATSRLPEPLRPVIASLLPKSLAADVALAVLKKAVLANEITRRLRSDPRLQQADAQRLQGSFERYISLDQHKRAATRDVILHLWGARQKQQLLAGTGSRLNSVGADVRRRFVLRGERAMRLRQVIAVGQQSPDGDPLFDLRPVWMASPETVAQVFPRKPLFDVIVFDEASQCRLEEALPVLLRAGRVVIAGDPKQLPPTRFFESAIATSDDDEIETDQQLFESQQAEIEDLLGAALNIEIEECYLDVHYRSRNSDLIEFSNENFYGSRLQPIPAHPSNRARFAPLTLYRAAGVYKDRTNEAEAERVCQIVRDLLRRAKPPSIGVACFNITQRDLILEKLDEMAEADPEFGRALGAAWKRQGAGSFEGLFVKNLENVQGDERDHMIISTTYGPDPSGRFYRRFGPLGRAGGGRRLNVLITRARDEVHIVTSIPQSEYHNMPPVPAGQSAGGPWLLLAYLAFAEQLAHAYEENHRILEQAAQQQQAAPSLNVRPTRYPSDFCKALGQTLVGARQTGSDVFWGNDGFCIDLAVHHPSRADDVTIGVLCDTTRFDQASDPVEWEIFRSAILQSQGWKLHRVWTPHFFRDVRGNLDAIVNDSKAFVAAEVDKDALPVRPA